MAVYAIVNVSREVGWPDLDPPETITVSGTWELTEVDEGEEYYFKYENDEETDVYILYRPFGYEYENGSFINVDGPDSENTGPYEVYKLELEDGNNQIYFEGEDGLGGSGTVQITGYVPGKPINPTPEDAALGIARNLAVLTWESGS